MPEPDAIDVGESNSIVSTLAALLPLLPEESVRQFHANLGTTLALPSQAHTRGRRLRGMLDFIADYGRPPTESEYVQLCEQGKQGGVAYVPLSTLIGYYGTYAAAIDHAARLYARGTAARTPAAKPAEKVEPRYWTEERTLQALSVAAGTIGHWPSSEEAKALRRAGVALLAGCGFQGLNLPPDSVIDRLFGSYEELTEVGKRRRRRDVLERRAIKAAGGATDDSGEVGAAVPAKRQSRRGTTVKRRTRSKRISV